MEIASGIVVDVLLGWGIFLMSLPFGVSRHTDGSVGHDPGAPKKPLLLIKATATTLIAAVFWVAIYWFIEADLISFREMSKKL